MANAFLQRPIFGRGVGDFFWKIGLKFFFIHIGKDHDFLGHHIKAKPFSQFDLHKYQKTGAEIYVEWIP
jgi:hypothetical protein